MPHSALSTLGALVPLRGKADSAVAPKASHYVTSVLNLLCLGLSINNSLAIAPTRKHRSLLRAFAPCCLPPQPGLSVDKRTWLLSLVTHV